MDKRYIISLDLETSSLDTKNCEILEIGAIAINPINFTIADKFSSLVKPDKMDEISQSALDVNRISKDELESAPVSKVVFDMFGEWITKFNYSNNNNIFSAPICAGWNIVNFDMPILDRYLKKYNFWDNKRNQRKLLSPLIIMDVMHYMWWLTRINDDIKSISMGNMLKYMGINKELIGDKAHRALWDAEQTANVIIKILKLGRFLTEKKEDGKRRLELKNCMIDNNA